MAKAKSHEEIMEAVVDYKKGWTNLASASRELGELAGFSPDIAAAFLKNMKRNNVTQIRGYEKTPQAAQDGRKGKPNEKKKF